MKSKLVYVLVSDETDYYYEMFQMSLLSFRLFHPGEVVVVIMDPFTYGRLKTKLSDVGVELKVVEDIPYGYSRMQCSRFLKTKMRTLICGDFLYIDNDTFVCESLDEIDTLRGSMGVVLENHGDICDYENSFYPKEWDYVLQAKHYNGGVLAVKDQEEAYRFFDLWHKNWTYCVNKGCSFDQPSLRKTVLESGCLIEELDGRWNCQVSRQASLAYQSTAKILHYQRNAFIVSICKKIRKDGGIKGEIASWVQSPREAFAQKIVYLSRAEYNALEPMRFMLNNYSGIYHNLVKITTVYQRLVASLSKKKNKINKLWPKR